VSRTTKAALAALLLLPFAHGNALAAGICTVILDDRVTWYISEPFPYATSHPDEPYFDDGVDDTAQARDFEAYVRRTYGVRGKVDLACHVYESGEIRKEGTHDVFGTTFRYIQTGYVPQGG